MPHIRCFVSTPFCLLRPGKYAMQTSAPARVRDELHHNKLARTVFAGTTLYRGLSSHMNQGTACFCTQPIHLEV